ncbi:uncharacterized protein A4U43_C03F4570 [Asparagus officinalis]|uniref:Phytocyanin domain-containing protein n=1 Tax=Asparagus officinalis TaxID=4686 RepID=A0A5P1F821_ASPOF|nr:uncharacterized protein A4U43_C03F4570 [Asparagus officinalis]
MYDISVFKYAVGKHNVLKADGPAFQACRVPPESEALTTGYDVITLATPGGNGTCVEKQTVCTARRARSWPSMSFQQHGRLLHMLLHLHTHPVPIMGIWEEAPEVRESGNHFLEVQYFLVFDLL